MSALFDELDEAVTTTGESYRLVFGAAPMTGVKGLSTLGRGELVRGIDPAGEVERGLPSFPDVFVVLLLKNDRIPLLVDVRFCSGLGLSSRVTIFHPTGAASRVSSLAFTEASHDVEPLDARYIAIGPMRETRL